MVTATAAHLDGDAALPASGHREPVATVRRLVGPLTGLVMWTVHLGAIYVVASLMHEHGTAADEWLGGMDAADVVIVVLTIAAAVPTAWAAWAGWRGWRRAGGAPGGGESIAGFGGALSAATNALFLFAIVLEGIGVLWLPG